MCPAILTCWPATSPVLWGAFIGTDAAAAGTSILTSVFRPLRRCLARKILSLDTPRFQTSKIRKSTHKAPPWRSLKTEELKDQNTVSKTTQTLSDVLHNPTHHFHIQWVSSQNRSAKACSIRKFQDLLPYWPWILDLLFPLDWSPRPGLRSSPKTPPTRPSHGLPLFNTCLPNNKVNTRILHTKLMLFINLFWSYSIYLSKPRAMISLTLLCPFLLQYVHSLVSLQPRHKSVFE